MINGIENKLTVENNFNEAKVWLFEKIDNIDKPLQDSS